MAKVAVRRVRTTAVKKTHKKAGRRSKPPEARMNLVLPTRKKGIERDIRAYIFLVYARAGWGKTTCFASFPDAMFGFTEPGAKGLSVMAFNEPEGISSWEHMLEMVRLLEADKTPRIKNVVIDTANMAYDQCSVWYCQQNGIEYPGETAEGKRDFGKSWKEIGSEFIRTMFRISRTGRGLGLVSHAKEAEIEEASGRKYMYMQPSFSGSAMERIAGFVDFGFFGDRVRTVDGENVRVLITDGHDGLWGKRRELEDVKMPEALIIPDRTSGYRVIRSAFLGVGDIPSVSIDDLRAGRMTSKAMHKMLARATGQKELKRIKRGGR